jgi:pyruvate/2-oxoglutarate dehydrogenase complex dihydrolipoamide acyltransferase (E2) component
MKIVVFFYFFHCQQKPEGSADVKVGTLIAMMVAEGEDWKDVQIPAATGAPTPQPRAATPAPQTVAPPASTPPPAAAPTGGSTRKDHCCCFVVVVISFFLCLID